ncbi:MAG: ABC transporter permease [Chloroflexia bacterium]
MAQLVTDAAEVAGPSAVRRLGSGSIGFFRLMFHNKAGFLGFLIFAVIVIVSLVGPYFTPDNPSNTTQIYKPPSAAHPFGTDFAGRDVLLQIIDGGRSVLFVGFMAATLTTIIAVVFGSISAYAGGWIDSAITGLADIVLTIPQLPLLAVLAGLIRFKSAWQLALIIAALAWPTLLRAVRAQVLSLRERDYVEAARALDLGTTHILFREILPNMRSYIAISFTIGMTSAIYAQVGLYFLGLAPLAGDNWGIMLNFAWSRGAIYFKNSFWYIMAPIIVISLLQLSMVTMTRSLEDIFNPRLREGQ